MKNSKFLSALWIVLITAILAVPALSQPFVSPAAFATKTDGTVVFASDWNSTIGGLYTYITGTLLPGLNAVTAKGDLYVYNGTALVRQPIGSNAQVLTADSAQSSGIKWAAGAGLPTTTKGDIIATNTSGTAVRLPVGSNGQILTADSTQTNGIAWENAGNLSTAPGMIIAYNPVYGGGIPTGWAICDGTNSTPNLIGMFVIGGQPSSGSSTANPSGYGNATYGTVYGSTLVGSTVNVNGTTSGPNNTLSVIQGSGSLSSGLASSTHTHTVASSGSFTTTNQPACYALVYIQKL